MGRANRRASAEEIDKMRALVECGMRDGAFGLSSGLEYVPGAYAPLEEIVELAKVAGRLGGHYQSHCQGRRRVGRRGGAGSHRCTVPVGGRWAARNWSREVYGAWGWCSANATFSDE
jgi:hypothetical protein